MTDILQRRATLPHDQTSDLAFQSISFRPALELLPPAGATGSASYNVAVWKGTHGASQTDRLRSACGCRAVRHAGRDAAESADITADCHHQPAPGRGRRGPGEVSSCAGAARARSARSAD